VARGNPGEDSSSSFSPCIGKLNPLKILLLFLLPELPDNIVYG
jgi:hypothetical protein